MKCNVGKTDKTIRYILGVAMMGAGVYFESWWGAVGLIPIVTASINFCPLYALLGLSSCKTEGQRP